jgi:diacylglycerol kinase (ATP)
MRQREEYPLGPSVAPTGTGAPGGAANESPFKGKTGLTRLINAAGYSWAGLRAAFRHEDAFRQETFLAVVLIPLAFYLGDSGVERALMIASVLLVLIVELLNSAVEAAVDRISLDHHLLIKRAKDMGSAAVLIALLNGLVVWGLMLLD